MPFIEPILKNGRAVVVLVEDNVEKEYFLDELVAKTFLPTPDDVENYTLEHLDGDPMNCAANNLQWVRKG